MALSRTSKFFLGILGGSLTALSAVPFEVERGARSVRPPARRACRFLGRR